MSLSNKSENSNIFLLLTFLIFTFQIPPTKKPNPKAELFDE
jgi:hypothetical protein